MQMTGNNILNLGVWEVASTGRAGFDEQRVESAGRRPREAARLRGRPHGGPLWGSQTHILCSSLGAARLQPRGRGTQSRLTFNHRISMVISLRLCKRDLVRWVRERRIHVDPTPWWEKQLQAHSLIHSSTLSPASFAHVAPSP